MPIEGFEQRYVLGVPEMDAVHREFVELVNRLECADRTEFAALFGQLVDHTQTHFDNENALMRSSGFPAIREHMDEHQRVLGELRRINERVQRGSTLMAKAYVREQLPAWFDLHAVTMDSALAAHLKIHTQTGTLGPVVIH